MSDLPDIAAMRAELGVSQVKLGDLLGVDQSTVSLWETGKTTPGGPAIRLLERLVSDKRSQSNEAAA